MGSAAKKRIAIIGAGPSGLSQLIAFKKAEQEQLVELAWFERETESGGLWQYTSLIHGLILSVRLGTGRKASGENERTKRRVLATMTLV